MLAGKKRDLRKGIILLMFGLSTGFFVTLSFSRIRPAWCGLPPEQVVRINGRALSDSRRLSSGSFILEMEMTSVEAGSGASADAGGKVLLFFNSNPAVYMGRLVSVEAELRSSEAYRQLADRQRLSGASMLRNEAVLTANPKGESLERSGWNSRASQVRAFAAREITKRYREMGASAGGLFAALFTGCRDGLTTEESRVFRRAGCSHILALSGMHLGILSGIILLLLKPLPGKKAAFAISCMIILAYLFLTGFGVSLVRAAVMYFICGAAMVFYRRYRGIDVLLLAFVVLVIILPGSFYTAAFQLSFLAVGGIILTAPALNRMMRPVIPAWLGLALSASIGAQLFVTPLLAAMFGELYPSGIIAGIIVAPLVTVFIWIGIIYLITGFSLVAEAADLFYRIIFLLAGKASKLPVLHVEGKILTVSIICTILLSGVFIYSLYRRRIDGLPD